MNGFALEPLDDLGHPPQLGPQDLEGHALIEAEVDRRDDDAHAALAEDVLHPVLALD